MWQTFVALGDSFTEGIGDPVDGIEIMGWADNVAVALRQGRLNFWYYNLARRGLLTAEICEQQLERAINLKPDLVSLIAGGNDILKGQWNPQKYEAEMSHMFEKLTATGATVMTATMTEFYYLPVSERVKTRLRQHTIELNEIVRKLAWRYNLVCVEMWEHPVPLDKATWSSDGIHPNALGYVKIAREALHTLEKRGATLDIARHATHALTQLDFRF